MKKILACLFIILLAAGRSSPLYAYNLGYGQKWDDAGLPGEYFTNFGSGARGFAMGKAYAALADDSSGPYWNPAGLVSAEANEISFLNAKLYAGTNYSFVGFGMAVSSFTAYGVSWAGVSVGGVEEYDQNGVYKGDFEDSHNAFYMTYSHKLSPSLNMGVNFKTLYHYMMTQSDTGFGFDLGLLLHPGRTFAAALNLENVPPLQPRVKAGGITEIYPINLKTGLALKLFDETFIWAADIDIMDLLPDKRFYAAGTDFSEKGKRVKWHTGFEVNIARVFAVRGGLDYKEASVGMGLSMNRLGIDYAAVFHNINPTHRFNVRLKFGVVPSAQERYFAEKMEKIRIEKKEIERKKEELEKARLELERREKVVEEIMMSTKRVEQERWRAHALQKTYDKALEYFDDGSYDASEKKAKEVLEMDPQDEGAIALVHLIKAHRYLAAGKYERTMKAVLDALEADPENTRAKIMLQKIKDILLLME